MTQQTWLMRFGLSGVQELISQSRSTRDTAGGSAIIADVMRAVIGMAKKQGATVLSPSSPEVACPNQAVIRVSGSEEAVGSLGASLVEAAHATFSSAVLESGWQDELEDESLDVADSVLKAQVRASLQPYWVAVKDDQRAEERLQYAFESRKLTRTFAQAEEFQTVSARACVQCGVRWPVVLCTDETQEATKGVFKSGERLCAVCAGRRRYHHGAMSGAVPSTRDFARGWRPGATSDSEEQQSGEDAGSYFAIVVFDGDRMGRWFSGERFENGDPTGVCRERLGQALAGFARSISDMVPHISDGQPTGQLARVLYLGGDDGLAFVSLPMLAGFLTAVHDAWNKAFPEGLFGDCSPKVPTVTLHASVVHEKAPLQAMLRAAHQDLDTAKDLLKHEGGFSVRAAVRSGGDSLYVATWDELDHFLAVVDACATVRREDCDYEAWTCSRPSEDVLRSRVTIPGKVLGSLQQQLSPLFGSSGECPDPGLVRLEAARILGRSGSLEDEHRDVLTNWLHDWRLTSDQRMDPAALERAGGVRGAVIDALEALTLLSRELDWKESRA